MGETCPRTEAIARRLGVRPLIDTKTGTTCARQCSKFDPRLRRCAVTGFRVVEQDSDCVPLVREMVRELEGATSMGQGSNFGTEVTYRKEAT